MNGIKLFDITEILRTNSKEYIFNPSISVFEKDTYFVSYRSIENEDGRHPWDNNWISDSDITKFCILEYKDEVFTKIHTFSKNIVAVDLRLIKHPTEINTYFGVGNVKIQNNNIKVGDNILQIFSGNKEIDCDSVGKCIAQLIYTIIIKSKKNSFELIITPPDILCKNLSSPIEKNWSLWFDNNDLLITYGLAHGPKKSWWATVKTIDFINMKTSNQINKSKSLCSVVNLSKNIKFDFSIIETNYKNMHLSLSTPSLKYNDGWISLGHIKIKNEEISENEYINKVIKFIKENCKNHHMYIYASFFYFFKKDEKNFYFIDKVSKLFIILDCNTSVQFITGIEVRKNNLLISYGDSDKMAKIILVDINSIEWIDNFNEEWKLMVIKTSE